MLAVKRVVDTDFWNDSKVSDIFSAEDKYFMLYLLTNPHTTQLGIYELPISKAANELGYSKDVVRVLIDRFENKYDLIKYNEITNELAIKNFLRHSIVKGGKPVMDCLLKEEKKVKDKSLLLYVFNNLNNYSDSLNITVKEFIDNININNNDNDNERIVPRIVNNELEELKKNFEIIYKSYPKKVGKTKAFESYKAFVTTGKVVNGTKHKLTNRQIWSAIARYKRQLEQNETEKQFIKNFDTFMNKAILDYVEEESE
ncbi:MAG: hypothetical protein II304_07050 [Bacteroidales bacterium]|nr:hypothetical protein [Bacteroidales bacterium]